MSYHARKVGLYPKDMLIMSGKSAKVLMGGVITDLYKEQVMYKEHRPEIQFLAVPGFGKVEYQFVVSGSGTISLSYSSRHARNLKKTVKLK
jgi:hypothetical protein